MSNLSVQVTARAKPLRQIFSNFKYFMILKSVEALADVALQGGYMQGIMLHSLGKICMMESDFFAQRNVANRLLKISRRPDLLVFFCWGQFNLACSCYHLNDLKAAKSTLASFMENRHIMYALAKYSGETLLFKGKDFSQTDIRPVIGK